jgi:hypothetical protein
MELLGACVYVAQSAGPAPAQSAATIARRGLRAQAILDAWLEDHTGIAQRTLKIALPDRRRWLP